MEPMESVKLSRASSKNFQVMSYQKLVVPVSMRSVYWQYFGFPANQDCQLLSRTRIVCALCRGQIAYNRNTSNLRMHLQSKHPTELSILEESNPRRIRKSSKGLTLMESGDSGTSYEVHEVICNEGDELGEIMPYSDFVERQDIMASEAPIMIPIPIKKARMERLPSGNERLDVTSSISNFIVGDLMPLDIVNGDGFQRLLLSLENPCSIPTKNMLLKDVIPNLYFQAKRELQSDIAAANYMAISIEEWLNDSGTTYATICTHYPINSTLVCKVLSTFPVIPEMDDVMWEEVLGAVFRKWNVSAEVTTAAVSSTACEPMVTALHKLGFNTLPCLHFALKECVQQVLFNDVISDIVAKVRKQVLLITDNPLTAVAFRKLQPQLERPLKLDVVEVWLSTLEMLDVAIESQEQTTSVLECHLPPSVFKMIEISEDEWLILKDVVNVLQALKMALMSVCEQRPYLSLIRPMLYQVIENKLATKPDDSDTAVSLKNAIKAHLNDKYKQENVASTLDIATIIDPRFKVLPHFSDDQRASMLEVLYGQIKDILVKNLDDEEEEEVDEKKNLSNMELMFSDYKQNLGNIDFERSARLEYQTYISQPNIRLDCDPLEWWSKQDDKYPRLCHVAQRLLCLPAITLLPGKKTLDELLPFNVKRSALDSELVDRLLFIHVNVSCMKEHSDKYSLN